MVISIIILITDNLLFNKGIKIQDGCSYSYIFNYFETTSAAFTRPNNNFPTLTWNFMTNNDFTISYYVFKAPLGLFSQHRLCEMVKNPK